MDRMLRVWWIPQVGEDLTPFTRNVRNVQQGHDLLSILAQYDLYQYENNIKPDYSNTGGLEMLDDDGDWVEWCDSAGNTLSDLEAEYDSYDLTAYFNEHSVMGLQFGEKHLCQK